MEALIVSAIILVLLICMGISYELIALIFLIFLDLLLLAIFVFFVYCLFRLRGGHIKTARFVKIDSSPKFKFKTAFYQIDGQEHANAFPAELLAKKLFYSKLRDKKVYLCKNGEVFDFYSLITVAAGLLLGSSSFVIMLAEIIAALKA